MRTEQFATTSELWLVLQKSTKFGQITPVINLCNCYIDMKSTEMVFGYIYHATKVNSNPSNINGVIMIGNMIQKYIF